MSRRKTLDAFPNYLSGEIILSAANTFTTSRENTPIPRLATSGARPTIMEVLWVDIAYTTTDLIADGDKLYFSIRTGGVPTGIGNLSEGNVMVYNEVAKSLTTSGSDIIHYPIRVDLQSSDGYGQLLAADAFNVSAWSVGQAAAIRVRWRMYYRFVQVPMSEYIGIVQSQSST